MHMRYVSITMIIVFKAHNDLPGRTPDMVVVAWQPGDIDHLSIRANYRNMVAILSYRIEHLRRTAMCGLLLTITCAQGAGQQIVQHIPDTRWKIRACDV